MFDPSLGSGLPDFGDASIIALGALLGALFGSAMARIQQADRSRMRELTEDGAFVGGLFGLGVYLLVILASRV